MEGLVSLLTWAGYQPVSLRSAAGGACLILRNSAEVVRNRYIRQEQEGTKVDGMTQIQQKYEQCATTVRQIIQKPA